MTRPDTASPYGQMIIAGAALVALAGFATLAEISPVLLFASIIAASQPLLFAAIGEMVTEKAGVLNLGVEGMMIIGAIAGFAAAHGTGSPLFGMIAAALAGMALSLVFGLLTQIFLANQVATGLALTLFGLGLAALIGQPFSGLKPPPFPKLDIPLLSDMPILGPLLFQYDLMVYTGLILTTLIWAILTFTRTGLTLRAVGEDHDAAHALGYRVIAIRLAAIAFGGAMAGIGGAHLSLVRVPQWSEGMTAGAGWIALAIVVFGTWNPWRVMLGAYLFGGVTILQINMQAAEITPLWLAVLALFLAAITVTIRSVQSAGPVSRWLVPLWAITFAAAAAAQRYPISIPTQYLSMAPYLATILVLTFMSSTKGQAALGAPAALGRIFRPSS